MAGVGALTARVVSAQTLDGARLKALADVLSEKCGAPVEIDLSVDASLIGGFAVNVGGCRFDGTFLSKLAGMKEYILRGDDVYTA